MSRFEYCAEAEPRLLKLQKDVAAGLDTFKALARLADLVGLRRFDVDWDAASAEKETPPGRDRGLFELDCFEAAHPSGAIEHRLYSKIQESGGPKNIRSVLTDCAEALGFSEQDILKWRQAA